MATVFINEFHYDNAGTDSNEFIEIAGAAGTDLTGYSIVLYNGSNGTSYSTTNLSGTIPDQSNGFGTVAVDYPSNGIQNGSPDGIALVDNNNDVVQFLSYEGSFTATNGPASGMTSVDIEVSQPRSTPVNSSLQLQGEGSEDSDFEWVAVDRSNTKGNINASQTFSEDDSDNGDDSDDNNDNDTDTPTPEDSITPIYEIQGTAHTSPLLGESVTTEGVVTAVDSNGFYLQDAAGDGDNATSDAIFVFTSSAPTVTTSNFAQVSGTVDEFFPGGENTGNLSTTQISNATVTIPEVSIQVFPTTTIIGAGGRVPPTENIDDDAFGTIPDKGDFDPDTDGIDFFESLEGMLVTAQDPLAVAPTNRFGEIFTVVDNGAGATGISDRGTLNISPDDFNPEKVQIDTDSGILPGFDIPEVNVGAELEDVTGVVSYGFGNFEIIPTEEFSVVTPSTLQPETTNIEGGADKLTVASYNVLNLDPNDNDGDEDVANGRFSAIASQIVNNLNAPDVIGLQEIQDNDGSDNTNVTSAAETLQQLVDAIQTAGGPEYEFIDNTFIGNNTSGGQPGGNIRTAFLYNSDRVDFVEDSLTAITDAQAQQTDEDNPFFGSRLPLAAKFTFNGEEVTVVNNHFSSKGGSAPILGVEQPFEERQEDVTVNGSLDERQAQAQAVKGYVGEILAEDSNANVVVLGDLNEFEFVSPVKTLADDLTNLTETVSENERYSFIFQGNSQSLDHILVSDNLKDNTEFDIVQVNSEFADTPQKASDHDPLVASLSIGNQNQQSNQNMIKFAGTVELEGAEISAYDAGTERIFVTGEAGEDNAFDIEEGSPILQAVDVSDPSNPTVIGQIDLSSYGAGVQSVAVNNGVVAVAVSAETSTDPGEVVFFNASDYSLISQVTVGALPDMLTFTPDGMKVLVANEGEPNDRYTVDPEGSVSIIDVSDISTPTVTTADFTAFNGQEDTLRGQGVRIFGEKTNPDGTKTASTAAEDFEPEYIAVSPDGTAAFVALQENNAFAVLDIENSEVTSILPLGFKDWSGTNPTLKPFKATFEGSQEVTPNTSTATGSAFLQLNQAGDALAYTMTIEGLDFGEVAGGEAQTEDAGDDVTGIHFHNAARGASGPVVFGIVGPAQDTDDRTITINDDGSTTISGVWETTDTAASESLTTFVADLQATNNDQDTNLYFNIHTEEFPTGEIRGQIMGSSVELDASNRDGEDADEDGNGDGEINFANYPNLFGMYQPDAIASYEVDGETYYITANEGDARIRPDGKIEVDGTEIEEGADFNEEARIGDDEIILDSTAFPNASELQEDENLGRLNITTTLGDTDGDGEFEELYAYGGRSFSIFNSSGELVYDSGDLIGKLTAELVPEKFNSQGDADSFDSRSDDKGAEPEGVTVGMVGDKTYAYVGLERTGGIMVFDVSNPTAASFVQYVNNEDDISPEGLTFINAEDSPNGNSLLAVSNEESETLSIYNAGSESTDTYTLQLLHAADQEAGIPALEDAPNFSAVLNALKNEDADSDGNADYENTLLLSSGDAYIPGIFLDASADESLAPLLGEEGRGRSDIIIQNELGFQAIALGNHEFDLGTEFIASVIAPDGEYPGANFPYLSANLDFSNDENLAPLVAEDGQEASTIPGQIAKSTIVTVNGEKIGVVGATTPTLASIASPGDVTISPENPQDIAALAAEIQTSVDALLADNPDLNKVVLISHMQQISIEEELAGLLKNVDIIMAGGSNTLLSDSTDRLRDGDTSQGAYPILKTDADGKPVAVVNTDGNYRYVGRLVVDFDENGEIITDSIDPAVSGAYATDDAGVAAVNGTPDPEIVAITDALEQVIADLEGNFFGVTDTFLNGTRADVRTQETNLGNLSADANLAIAKEFDEDVVISIKNGGGIRDNIGRVVTPAGATEPEFLPPEENELAGKPEGGISQVDIQNALRFNNGLTLLTATAEELLAIIEHGVSQSEEGATPGRFPQVSGLNFSFDDDLPAGDRVQSLAVVDEDGEIIDVVAQDGELQGDASRTFRLVTLGFLAGGGDDYPFPERDVVELAQEEDAARTGDATFAPDGSEQDALAEFLATNFSEENPFSEEDVAPAQDMRIQNLDFREDTVLEGFVEEIPIAATTLADGTTVESIDLTGLTGQATINYTISREADFDNEVYFYEVDNINGTVDGIAVGEAGYMEAALGNIISPEFSTSDDNTETASAQFDAGSVVVPLIIADGTLAEALSGDADIYFPYLGANTDNGNFDHIRLLDDNTFGFEDLPNGGDRDFNDIQIRINSIA